jgi:hypothetical protein
VTIPLRWLAVWVLVSLPSLGCVTVGMGLHQQYFKRETHDAGVKPEHLHGPAMLEGVADPNSRDARFSKDCSVAVALSGGGTISASFTYGVIREMAALSPMGSPTHLRNPVWQVDYFSTASGGGITAALVEVLMREVEREKPADWDEALTRKLDGAINLETFSENYFSKGQLLFQAGTGVLQLYHDRLPVGIFGKGHECGAKEPVLTVGAAFPSGPSVFPIWVPNATAFWDGRRVPLTPQVLKTLAQGGRLRPEGTTFPCADVLGDAVENWLVTDLLAASMSFPGVGPYRLVSKRDGQEDLVFDLVDGGIADNLGTASAFDLLSLAPSPRKLLLVVDASADAERGVYTRKRPITVENYLGELGNIFLAAQYPEAKRRAEELARAKGIDLVWIRLQDVPDDAELSGCPDLRSETWTEAGQRRCEQRYTQRAADFINNLKVSVSIPADEANGLMQLGRLAARRSALAEKLQRCLSP